MADEPALLLLPPATRQEAAPALPLPRPVRERFQPLRAGIVNLWQYDDQELPFHQGRLILRGENGAGKSKALELLLPFLFDADLSPQRLDPFGGTSRSMEWNLLQDGRYESRIGYVWLELGRRHAPDAPDAAHASDTATGTAGAGASAAAPPHRAMVGGGGGTGGAGEDEEESEAYWTLGCGLRATQRTRRVDAWFFLTRQRIGRGLALLTPARTPLLKEQLRLEIGARGWVFETGRDYREKLDQHLFGLGEESFSTLRHLLLQLRRPHLSEKLDPQSLASLLKESLPALDRDLVGQLSEGFERLEKEQQELARTREAVQETAAFLDLYRDYARGLARGRAAEVRRTDSSYHRTAAEMRKAQTDASGLEERIAETAGRERQAEADLVRVTAAIAALAESPEMRTAAVLRTLGEKAAAEERRAAEAVELVAAQARRVEGRRRDLGRAAEEAERAAAQRDASAEAAATAAGEAGLAAACDAACAVLAGSPGAAQATIDAAVRRRREGIEEMRRLAAERDRAQGHEERAQERLREAAEQQRAAVRRRLEAEAGAAAERQALQEGLTAWLAGLAELVLSEPAAADLLARAAGLAPGTGDPLGAAIAAAARRHRDLLVASRSALEMSAERVTADRQATEEERQRVLAARELGPAAPPLRQAERAGRPGAPLYMLCDFAPGLEPGERAGLEAALEAAGLLDAWVMPDGRVLAEGTLDSFLVAELPVGGIAAGVTAGPAPAGAAAGTAEAAAPGTAAGTGKHAAPGAAAGIGERAALGAASPATPGLPTLAGRLVPVPGHGVEREVLEALLHAVTVPSEGAGAPAGAVAAVDAGGAFRLGPLRGAAGKPVAEHIGAGARAAARERRLAELTARIGGLDRELARLAAEIETLGARLTLLDREVAAAPSAAPLLDALSRAVAALADEERRGAERAAAQERAAAAHAALTALQERVAARARELQLSDEAAGLDEAAERLHAFTVQFRDLAARVAEAARTGEHAAAVEHELRQEMEAAEGLERRREESEAKATEARAHHAEIEATAGADARQVVSRHAEHVARREALNGQLRTLRSAAEAQKVQLAGAATQARNKEEDLARFERERAQAAAALRRFAECGLLALCLTPAPEDAPAGWPLTRTLDVARELERESQDVDLGEDAASRRSNRLYERFRLLEGKLGADFTASLEHEGELVVVRILYNGRQHDVAGLAAVLRDAVQARQALLDENEKRLFHRFMLHEFGEHLRRRLADARKLVLEMNRELAECRTASGMALRLSWAPAPDAPSEVRDVLQLLQRDLALLSAGELARVEGFFAERLKSAREQLEAVPWRDHLLAALDYRSWFAFHVQRRLAGEDRWEDLTRRGHGASSGGEKAVALHLPLFAAAAAHYRSALPTAPRIILLDEAFAGIDQAMRGRCMGLLVALDLDFLMTSHDEWGCHAELPGVAIASLVRDPTFEGVAAAFAIWNGSSLEEVTEGAGGSG